MSETSNTHPSIAHSLLGFENASRVEGEFAPPATDEINVNHITPGKLPTTNNELHEGDTVRVTRGKYYHKIGTIERIGRTTGSWIDIKPLYIVKLHIGPLVFLRDEIERVESEVPHE